MYAHRARETDPQRDGLTGLATRSRFDAVLAMEVDRARRTRAPLAVLAIDLDNFHDFNDALGHGQASSLLAAVAERLRASQPGRLVARLGGDCFGLVAREEDGVSPLELAVCVRAALDEPFAIAGLRLAVSAGVGLARFPGDGEEAEQLLRHAETAVQRAKARGTGIEAYDPAADPHSRERLVLAAELRDALSRDELVLHYQPKVRLSDGEAVGAEALIRWRHPRRGLIQPGDFIELAERSDLIGPLTMHVLRGALAQTAAWRRAGLDLPVAVNLPARMLLDSNLPGDVASLLARSGLDGTSLVLEITESSLIHDPVRAARTLDSLSALGVRIAIDDYGSGYSSLGWLKSFPVDEIKLDRSFIANLAWDERDAAIVRSTIELGHSLGITVVAEGADCPDVLDELASYGCDVVQGFLVSPPVPGGEIAAWARGRTARVEI